MSMRAFTLVEVLVYLGLFSILMTGVISSLLLIRAESERLVLTARVTDEGHFLLAHLRHSVAEADTILSPVLGASSSEMILSTNAGALTYRTERDSLLRESGAEREMLSEQRTTVQQLVFSRIGTTSVGVSFTISSPSSASSRMEAAFEETLFFTVPIP